MVLLYGPSKNKQNFQKIDIEKLRKMCVSKYGLVQNDIRRLVWPILLNTDVITENQINLQDNDSWMSKYILLSFYHFFLGFAKIKNKEYIQIEKDINRSLKSFDECQKWTKTIK